MAHKTLIGGTTYDITGGKTLVSGTSYSVKNGKVLIGGTVYDISFILPPDVLDLWSGSKSTLKCIAYGNGYWVAGGGYYDGSTYCARIAYSTSLSGTWTTNDLWSSNTSINTINCITYADGYWVAGGGYYDSSAYYGRIAYTTAPSGTWTTKDLYNGTGSSTITGITYADGYWVVSGRRSYSGSYYARISYSTSLSGTWTNKNLWDGNSSNIMNCVTYGNGYWIAGGNYYANGYYYRQIAYATELSGTWATKSLWTDISPNSKGDGINCITYADGYWVIGGDYYDGATYYARIAYTSTPSGTWATKDLWNTTHANGGGISIDCITCANGCWVVGGEYYNASTNVNCARIAYSTSLSGTWTNKDLWSGDGNSNVTNIQCVTYANGYWVAGGQTYVPPTYQTKLAYAGSLEELGTTQ